MRFNTAIFLYSVGILTMMLLNSASVLPVNGKSVRGLLAGNFSGSSMEILNVST